MNDYKEAAISMVENLFEYHLSTETRATIAVVNAVLHLAEQFEPRTDLADNGENE